MLVKFKIHKTTPGTHCYEEVDDKGNALTPATGAKIGKLYVRKEALNGAVPQTLEVTIRVA